MVGSVISAIDSVSGNTRLVSAIVTVGRPSPTRPFTVPASRNTASPKTIWLVVTTASSMPPGDDGGDQGEHGDDLGETDIPGPAGEHRFDFRLDALDLLPFTFGDEVQAVDQARQAPQALRQGRGGAAARGARSRKHAPLVLH